MRLHLDSSGDIAAHYRYGPFGEAVGDDSTGYGYSGEQWHGEVGLLYLRARYYRPEIGRFASRDLWPGVRQLPETLHRYVYVGNAP